MASQHTDRDIWLELNDETRVGFLLYVESVEVGIAKEAILFLFGG